MTSADHSDSARLPDGVREVLGLIGSSLGDSVRDAYLFGSSMVGGLRPDSDLDVLVAVEQSLSDATRRSLVAALMDISGDAASGASARPVELTVVRLSGVVPWRYPARSELVYGEWLRAEFEAGKIPPPDYDPDLAIVLAKARQHGFAMVGPSARDLFDPVPVADLRRAIGESLPALIGELRGDERNVLLTLARMRVTLSTGEIVPKDVAAQWALDRLPAEYQSVLALARRAYSGACRDDWTDRGEEVDAFVRYAVQSIRACLRNPQGR